MKTAEIRQTLREKEEAFRKLEAEQKADAEAREIDREIEALRARKARILGEKYGDREKELSREMLRLRNMRAEASAPPAAPVAITDALKRLTDGTTANLVAMEWSDDHQRVIAKWPGHSFQSAGNTRYGKTEWFLLDLSKEDQIPKGGIGGRYDRAPLRKESFEGRLSGDTKTSWRNYLKDSTNW